METTIFLYQKLLQNVSAYMYKQNIIQLIRLNLRLFFHSYCVAVQQNDWKGVIS